MRASLASKAWTTSAVLHALLATLLAWAGSDARRAISPSTVQILFTGGGGAEKPRVSPRAVHARRTALAEPILPATFSTPITRVTATAAADIVFAASANAQARIWQHLHYPRHLRAARISGNVRAVAELDPRGALRALVIEQGSGHAELDTLARSAIEAAAPFPEFAPQARVVIPIEFKTR